MNRYFDFTSRQLKFLIFLTALMLVLSVFQFVKMYAVPQDNAPTFQVYLGEDNRKLTGVFQLDPNNAPVDSLELLPGIGKVLADRIVVFRQNERFEKEIDITDVKGIGPKLYERIKPYLKVNPN